MNLPNGHASVVEIEKIRDYCLSLTHPRGRHKARVYQSALGITDKDSEGTAHGSARRCHQMGCDDRDLSMNRELGT